MIRKTWKLIFVLTITAIFTMSCVLTNMVNKDKDGIGGSEDAPSASDAASSGDTYRSEMGGFEFKPLEGYEISEFYGMVQMIPPGADEMTGPMIMLLGGLNDTEMDNDTLLEKMSEDTPDAEFSKPKNIKVDGIKGYEADLTSTYEGESIEGQIVVMMVTPIQQFVLLGAAPEGEWKSVKKDFEKVLKSVNFFEPDPNAMLDEPAQGVFEESSLPAVEVGSDGMLRQWASSAVASSEYGSQDWSATQATGAPDVEECGDNPLAWASVSATSVEWLELTYDVPVIPYEITIIQNYNASQVVDVTGITENGDEYLIVEAEPEYVEYCPDYWTITIEPENEAYIKTLRITIDQSVLGSGWNEIDAVELVGIPQGGAASIPSSPQSGNDTPANTGGASAPYSPDELDPGSFSYSISGYENNVVMGADVQYQSTDPEYVVGMISGDMRYAVSIFFPEDGLSQGNTTMKPYDSKLAIKGPTAAIYINSFLYIAESGEFFIDNDPSSGEITGTYYFVARSKDFPDRVVEISGSMNKIPLR